MTTAATRRFDRIAENYAKSEVHASSPTIDRLHRCLSLSSDSAVIDVACGAGHFALSFGGRVRRIVGVDGSPSMLSAFRQLAGERSVIVEAVEAMSDSLPFETDLFDAAVSRLAPHHFPSLYRSVAEMARIVRPGGFVAVIDLHGYDDPAVDDFNHELELLHDPTHVRSHAPSVWRSTFGEAGLSVTEFFTNMRESRLGVSVRRWCEIAASGSVAENEIRRRLAAAAPSMLDALDIVRDPQEEFLIPVRTLLCVGRKPV